jgi:hypothetical protein
LIFILILIQYKHFILFSLIFLLIFIFDFYYNHIKLMDDNYNKNNLLNMNNLNKIDERFVIFNPKRKSNAYKEMK